jgi:hypothetical protein
LADKTIQQYQEAVKKAQSLFEKKTKDYGTSWRILRLPSLTDQIFIKAQRIRTIDLKGQQMINDSIESEFIGILNYSIIALIQIELNDDTGKEIDYATAIHFYEKKCSESLELMLKKNHDYGEAWRDMRISSFTDLILMRIMRIRQIEDNRGNTLVSEGIDSNLYDIINYSIFALIKLSEKS